MECKCGTKYTLMKHIVDGKPTWNTCCSDCSRVESARKHLAKMIEAHPRMTREQDTQQWTAFSNDTTETARKIFRALFSIDEASKMDENIEINKVQRIACILHNFSQEIKDTK